MVAIFYINFQKIIFVVSWKWIFWWRHHSYFMSHLLFQLFQEMLNVLFQKSFKIFFRTNISLWDYLLHLSKPLTIISYLWISKRIKLMQNRRIGCIWTKYKNHLLWNSAWYMFFCHFVYKRKRWKVIKLEANTL